MKLNQGLHLAYCTNIHRGQDWPQTFDSLERYTLRVREQVCPREAYAIGLRLGDQAARELAEPATLLAFQHWLDANDCYVFTINGFPYGAFHGQRVKEQVYAPDWTTPERLDYTIRLFELLAKLTPPGVEGSVSTVPCSFKEFIQSEEQVAVMRRNLWQCVERIEQLSEASGKTLHLGLEPEPLCYLETTDETIRFFDQLRADRPHDDRLSRRLGVNYDTCHLAVEFEDAPASLERLRRADIMLSKLHLSSALTARPTPETRAALAAFADDIYFHQVVSRSATGELTRVKDLNLALEAAAQANGVAAEAPEWRIHFHIPLHSPSAPLFGNTTDHLLGALDTLQANPGMCHHLEMETYTWEVLPSQIKNRDVVTQLVAEYDWTLRELTQRGLGPATPPP